MTSPLVRRVWGASTCTTVLPLRARGGHGAPLEHAGEPRHGVLFERPMATVLKTVERVTIPVSGRESHALRQRPISRLTCRSSTGPGQLSTGVTLPICGGSKDRPWLSTASASTHRTCGLATGHTPDDRTFCVEADENGATCRSPSRRPGTSRRTVLRTQQASGPRLPPLSPIGAADPLATARTRARSASCTSRCARSRSSSGYFLGAGTGPSPVASEPPSIPGRFNRAHLYDDALTELAS